MRRNLLLHVGQAGAVFFMAVLGLVDLNSGMGVGSSLDLAPVQVLSAVATAVVWLPAHRQGSTRLPKVAMLLAGFSLLLTIGIGVFGGGTGASFGSAEAVGLLGVLFVVTRRGDPNWAVPAVLLTGIAIGFLPLRGGLTTTYVIAGLALGLAATAVIALGVYLRTIESTRKRAMDSVRSEQRAEFARDLHDFIAHHVTGIVVQAQGARFIAEQDPKRVMLALEQIEAAGAETMASMRRMVGVLRDPNAQPDAPLAPLAGVDELGQLLESFTNQGDVLARLHVDGSTTGIPVEVSTSAYRVVMEALTNIRRHAQGARVADVWVRRTPDWLLVRVANDGAPPRAATPREAPGYGLVGLTERVRAVGGRITAGPGIDGGWVVDAALPLDQEVTR
ncbi:sensor histidine kinase [Actinoplanes friuliensis]|uniref:histidine kinase n=1 Tax=Actinoplanes friuliensis DSM 7358 TaxID=1246995 RepID=U5W5Y0_9ACTN|nr:histidine kinase [Actinoplanes friuliensis]AGZ43410.1 Sensor histidine kinase yxjM [Actinoplanes friuliensis DSM 7358]